MGENLHNIDDLFKKAINELDDIPSPAVWGNIDKNLDKKNALSITKKYQKLKWVAAALLIFSAGMAMYTWHTRIRNRELVKQNNSNRKKLYEEDQSDKINPGKAINTHSPLADSTEKKITIKEPPNTSAKTVAGGSGLKDNKITNLKKFTITKATAVSSQNDKKLFDAVKNISPHQQKKAGSKQQQRAVNNLETTALAAKISAEEMKGVSTNKTGEPVKELTDNIPENRHSNAATVYEQKRNFSELQQADATLEKSLETLTNNNTIKTQPPSADQAAQNKKNSAVKITSQKAITATLFYSPDLVSSRVDNDTHHFREDDRNAIKSKEKIINTWTAGVLINYNIAKNILLESGLSFSALTTNIQPKTIFARPDQRGNINYRFNCSAGYTFVNVTAGNPLASGDSITALTSSNTLQYISIPLALRYSLIKGKFSINPGAGVVANILTKAKIETVIAGSPGNKQASINHIEGLNRTYASGLISVGVNYNISKYFALNFTPVARFALTAINNNTPVKTYYNSFGLMTGINIKL